MIINCDKQTVISGLTTLTIFDESAIDDADGDSDVDGDGDDDDDDDDSDECY